MKIRTVLLLTLCFSTPAFAYEYRGSQHQAQCIQKKNSTECTLQATGIINLNQTRSPVSVKNIFFSINDHVKGVLKLYHRKVNNANEIKGFFFVDNHQDEKSYIKYKVIFKDKKGAVAQSAGEIHLDGGKNQRKKFGTVDLTAQDMQHIDTYEIQMVESNKPSVNKVKQIR